MAVDPDSIRAEFDSLILNDELLAARVRDMEKRFDTLQTPLYKRVWWWVAEGWPWYDLNAPRRQWRPWYRGS